jgi:hypothetical protein
LKGKAIIELALEAPVPAFHLHLQDELFIKEFLPATLPLPPLLALMQDDLHRLILTALTHTMLNIPYNSLKP